jgi:hypothetical protein
MVQSFEELQRSLLGETIFVTDESGRQTRGVVVDVSASTLVVSSPERRTFAQDTIREIRRPDRLWNGMLIGLAAGIVPGLFLGRVSCGEGPSGTCTSGPIKGALFVGGIGAAIGVAIDEFVKRPGRIVYVSSQKTRPVMLSPLLGKDRQGVLVSVRF